MNAAPKGRSRDARPGQRPKPSSVAKDSGTGAGSRTNPVASPGKPKKEGKKERDWQETYDPKTEARMNKAVRDQGKLTKRKGKLVSSGTGEFQIASGYDLEKMASR
jgi:ATP-dependent RNA helicase DDX31/DBP7